MKQGTQINIRKIGYDDPRFKLYNNLQSDAARFVTFREAQKARELSAAKTDLDKSRIEKKYKEYLATEKQGIFANAAAAERWQGFQENADIYPNLQWRTAGDSDVRPEHARLNGLTLPINDPFWNTHTPPLGFGCRCELVQTDESSNHKDEKYNGYKDTPAPKGFDFNPGIEQTLFSDSAGYYTNAPKSDLKTLKIKSVNLLKKNVEKSVMEAVRGEKLDFGGKEIVINRTGIEKTRSKNKAGAQELTAMFNIKNLQEMIDNGTHTAEEFLKKDPEKMNENKGVKLFHKWEGKGYVIKAREDTLGNLFFYFLEFIK